MTPRKFGSSLIFPESAIGTSEKLNLESKMLTI